MTSKQVSQSAVRKNMRRAGITIYSMKHGFTSSMPEETVERQTKMVLMRFQFVSSTDIKREGLMGSTAACHQGVYRCFPCLYKSSHVSFTDCDVSR